MIPAIARPILVALLVHVVSRFLARRLLASDDGPADPDRYVDADRVVCPSCRAENDRGYRFCRECLGELPGAIDRATSPSGLFRPVG